MTNVFTIADQKIQELLKEMGISDDKILTEDLVRNGILTDKIITKGAMAIDPAPLDSEDIEEAMRLSRAALKAALPLLGEALSERLLAGNYSYDAANYVRILTASVEK